MVPPAGASDCASCCGVLLELARTVIADRSVQLAAPLVFLLNGGEETFLQVLRRRRCADDMQELQQSLPLQHHCGVQQ